MEYTKLITDLRDAKTVRVTIEVEEKVYIAIDTLCKKHRISKKDLINDLLLAGFREYGNFIRLRRELDRNLKLEEHGEYDDGEASPPEVTTMMKEYRSYYDSLEKLDG